MRRPWATTESLIRIGLSATSPIEDVEAALAAEGRRTKIGLDSLVNNNMAQSHVAEIVLARCSQLKELSIDRRQIMVTSGQIQFLCRSPELRSLQL